MRKLTMMLALLMLPLIASAQWVNQGAFPDTSTYKAYAFNSTHGLSVDADGKIWVLDYYPKFTVPITLQDINGQDSAAFGLVGGIFVYDSEGAFVDSVVAFGEEWIGGEVNSAGNWEWNSGRGMRYDPVNDDILVMMWSYLYRVDAQTLVVKSKLEPNLSQGSKAAPAFDAAGNVYVGPVVGADGTVTKYSYDAGSNTYGAGEDLFTMTGSFSRSFEVSPDGNTVFWAGYTGPGVLKYSRADEFDTFGAPDTVLRGIRSETFTYHPTTGDLYVGAGSLNDVPAEPWTPQKWYAFDPATIEPGQAVPTDSLGWVPEGGEAFDQARPRALAFSPDGKTAYIGMFSSPYIFSAQKLTNETVSVDDEFGGTPKGFALEQNYPNPFNPSTQIDYTLAKSEYTSLRVYDMLGREVAVLVDGQKAAGSHSVTFDASNLSSGTYIYVLQSGSVKLTNKMTLIK